MNGAGQGGSWVCNFCLLRFSFIFNCMYLNLSECGYVHLSADNLKGQKKASGHLEGVMSYHEPPGVGAVD